MSAAAATGEIAPALTSGLHVPALLTPIDQRLSFSAETIAAAKNVIAPGAPDHIIALVLARCQSLGADPMARMIYAVNRKRKNGVSNIACFECGKPLRKSKNEPEYYCWRQKQGCGATFPENDERIVAALARGGDDAGDDNWTLQSSIDFFRATAESSSGYAGQVGPHWCGEDGSWREIWLKKWGPPAAARVGIMRSTFAQPLYTTAMFDEFAGLKKDGEVMVPSEMWAKMPALMLAKCAEALAIRRAFPAKLSGLYVAEEMDQADNEVNVTPATAKLSPVPAAAVPATASVTALDEHRQPPEPGRSRKELMADVAAIVGLELGPKGGFKSPDDAMAVQNALQKGLGLERGKPIREYTDAELAAFLALQAAPAAEVAQQPAQGQTSPSEPKSGRILLAPALQAEIQKLLRENSWADEDVQDAVAAITAESDLGVTYDWHLLTVHEAIELRDQIVTVKAEQRVAEELL